MTNTIQKRTLGTVLCLSLAAVPVSNQAASRTDAEANRILATMTLEEKVGQMTQVDSSALKDPTHVTKYFLGSVLSGGGSDPTNNSPEAWAALSAGFQDLALKTRLKIPLLYGVDAVHGHNNVIGAVVFPHNIGLGATRNENLIEEAARVTAREIAGTQIHWAFSPCVTVPQNIRWGRTYEGFGDSPELVSKLGAAATEGFQSGLPGGFRVLACVKHYVGDGGTKDGIDQGNTICDEATLRKLHLAPYIAAIKENPGSMMVSYNSWNGEKLHGHKYLLTDVLKGELQFQGFLVSDWAAIDQLTNDYKAAIEKSINAGMDMAMIPNGPGQKNNYEEFIRDLKQLVQEGKVPQARIDDAVRRILRAKIEMGLFKAPYAVPRLAKEIGSPAHRKVARECVAESLVLLKNDHEALPLPKKAKRIIVVGKAANDLGIQCGGWTIDWQGKAGEVTKGGTTILEALRKSAPRNTEVVYSPEGEGLTGADRVVVVIGEQPYAEMKGDRADLSVPKEDIALVEKARQAGAPVVTVLLSGRPLVLGPVLAVSKAVVAAWLPGTEGLGVADVLYGTKAPKGKLPRPWPRSNEQVISGLPQGDYQFPFGYGLTY